METMSFKQLLQNRRSIRNYQDKKVPVSIIHKVINDSILAPSAGNEQPWNFIIVNNRDYMNRISVECKKNMLARIENNPGDYARKYEKMLRNEEYNIFYNAPGLVLILGDGNLKNLYVDCALAASYFMMSAASNGLGTCWINFGTEIYDTEMRNDLGIPANYKIVAPIAIGYPVKIPAIPRREEPQILKVVE